MAKSVLLTLVSIIVAVVIGEASIRMLCVDEPKPPEEPKKDWALVPERVWTEHHPLLGWYHQTSKQAVLKGEMYQIELNTNSAGFRGTREYEKVKPSSVYRIIALGDSFVFGWGTRDEEAFPARLEQMHENLEVINLGVAGYGLDQLLLSFRYIGTDYRPDCVLIGVFPEDFWRCTRSFADTGHAKPYFSLSPVGELELRNVPVPPKFHLRTNQFPEVIRYGKVERFFMQSVVYRVGKKAVTRLGKNLGWIDPDTTEEWILGRAILKRLISEIRDSGARPVLVVLPPDRWLRDIKATALRKSLNQFARKEEVDFLDLTPAFYEATQKSKLTDYYLDRDWHWTAEGHALAARLIGHYLDEKGIFPRK